MAGNTRSAKLIDNSFFDDLKTVLKKAKTFPSEGILVVNAIRRFKIIKFIKDSQEYRFRF